MSIREELYEEIESTKIEFHKLLNSIPVEAYNLPSDNPDWNVGEVLYHMSIAPRMIGADVKMITGQSWFYRLFIRIMPKSLFNWLNKVLTRYGARNGTPEFLAQVYNKAHNITLKALAEVTDADFEKKLQYPDWDPMLSGEVTLERLFHYIKRHFDSHAEQLRQIIKDYENK